MKTNCENMKDYCVYVNHTIKTPNGVVNPGVYIVKRDNEAYTNAPSRAAIQTPVGVIEVELVYANIFDEATTGCFAVFNGFDPGHYLEDRSDEDMLKDLKSIGCYERSVNEYIERFVSIKAAWKAAVLYDNTPSTVSKRDMDVAFARALTSF